MRSAVGALHAGTHAADDGIGWLVADTDYLRCSPTLPDAAGHKEWQHFVIMAPGVELLVNFSLCSERHGAAPDTLLPRIVLLARAGEWDGDVEAFGTEDTLVCAGGIDMRLQGNSLTCRDGRFDIRVGLRDRPIRVDLQLTAVTHPAFSPSIPMLEGPPLQWVVLPRLEVAGTLTVADRAYVLDGALAYHDHNWGRFRWGHDVAWEWGFVLPEHSAVPWCLTFVRLTNRARTLLLEHKLLLWHGQQLMRIFREDELEVHTGLAYARQQSAFQIPRPMALLAPQAAIDVPSQIETRARAGSEWVECCCATEDVAQVLIPNETRLGVTIFNEVVARSSVHGCVGGMELDFTGRSILEFIRVC